MNGCRWGALLLLAAAAGVAVSCTRHVGRGAAGNPEEPLVAGWLFACAITNDPHDRAVCQERVALALLERGELELALERGAQIGNWRKGILLAEASAAIARNGRRQAALELAAQAEEIGRAIQDWQRDRILARTVKARALLGDTDTTTYWNAFYRTNQEYRGEVAAYHALALARAGQTDQALAMVDALSSGDHLDVLSWRAQGYLLLAECGLLDEDRVRGALDQAWAACASVPGNRRFDLQLELVDTAVSLGATGQAQGWLEEMHPVVLQTAAPAHIMAPVIAGMAVRWGALGEAGRLEECERAAELLIGSLQAIEQPALLALLGEARVRQGDEPKGLAHYGRAMELAGALVNPRPRAIACVDICLSLDRARLRHGQLGEGLKRLLAGFGAAHG